MAATTPGQAEAAVARVPALSMELLQQSHDAKSFVVLPQRWVGRHVAPRLNIDGDRQGDLAADEMGCAHPRTQSPSGGLPNDLLRSQRAQAN